MMTIYFYSNGDVAVKVLQALSALMSNFNSAVWIATVFSGLITTFIYMKTHDISVFIKLFLINVLVVSILVVPKVSVRVYDASNPMETDVFVDHVPWGVAFPASLATSLLYGLTQEFEDVFHMPNDLEYNRTGMLFGAKLFQATMQTAEFDSVTKENFNNFVENCIIPDIAIHKYTWSDIVDSPNIFQTLDGYQMSPLRGIYINNDFQTCQQAYPQIKQSLQDSANKQLAAIGTELFGEHTQQYQGMLPDMIQNTYTYMLNDTSATAQSVLLQNTAMNYFRNSFSTLGARLDAPAAMQLNYAYTSAMQKQNESNFTMYRMATYTLPLLQTTFLLLLIGCFPLVILLALQPPLTELVLKNYIIAYIYLGSWALLYAITNFIFTSSLSFDLSAQPLSLSNVDQLMEKTTNFVSISGYVLSLIPFLPMLLIRGFASGLSNMAQYFGGTQHSLASGAASEAATGNLSIGNMSEGNRSWNNTHANKFDTNVYHASGASTVQGADGVLNTTYADGSAVINASSAISQGAFTLNFANTDSSSIQKNFTRSMSSARAESTSAENILQGAFNKGVNWSAGQGSSQALHYATSEDEAAHVATAYGDILSIAKDYNQRQGLDDSHIGNTVSSLVSSIGLSADGKLGSPSALPLSGSVSVSGGVKGQSEAISSHTTTAHNDYGIGLSDSDQQRLSHDVSILSNYGSRVSADSNSHKDMSLVDQQAYSIYQSQQHIERANADYQQAVNYQNQMSQMQSDSQSYNLNRTQAFVEWGKNLSGADGYQFNTLIDQAMKGDLSPNAASYLNSYITRFENSNPIGSVNTNSINSFSQGIHQQYENNSSKLNNESTISNSFESNSNKMTAAHGYQVGMDKNKFNRIRSETTNALQDNNVKISQGKDAVVNQTGSLKNEITNIQPSLQERANDSASGLALDKLTKPTPQEKAESQKKYQEFSSPFKTNDMLNKLKED